MRKKHNTRGTYSFLLHGRQFSQLVFAAIFVFLFIRTDYSGTDELEYVVNIFFRLDPFLASLTMLAARSFIALMLPSILVIALALVFGRSFCGWFCPMGTLLDGARSMVPTDRKGKQTLYPRLAKWLFIAALLLAFLGFHIGSLLDPFSLLVRCLAQSIYPAFHGLMESFFTFTYTSAPASVNTFTEPVYGWLNDFILPAERKFFELSYVAFFLLGLVVFLEIAQKRFFCRNICPLGAMLSFVSKHGVLGAEGGSDECGKCRVCSSICRMGAIDERRVIDMSTCNLCFECCVACPKSIIEFGYTKKTRSTQPNVLARRHFLGILATGLFLPAVKNSTILQKQDNPLLIRPPGALAERQFTGRCVRCGECYQVCIGNALQPALLEGGLDALFSPKLAARTGYCEYNCTLCGQVCPTGAIKELTLQEKHVFKIGNAWFDKNRCLPFAKNISCMVCEEHCPTAEKAIRFKDEVVEKVDGSQAMVKMPYVVDDLCIGCGICEYKCPLPGHSAIIVTNANEQRNPQKQIPVPSPYSYG